MPHSGQRIWAIGGGKGGVGKSLFGANFALILASLGKSVVAIDLDLGNANLHTCLGIRYPKKTLADFFSGNIRDLNEILQDTSLYNLKLISGSGGVVGSANIWHGQRLKLHRYFEKLHVDHVVLDLGAGTSFNTIDFFLDATDHIIVTTPETPSVQSAYNFVRISLFRKLYSLLHTNTDAWGMIEKVKIPNPDTSQFNIESVISALDPLVPEQVNEFRQFLKSFHPYIIVNMALEKEDEKVGWGLSEVVKKYLGVEMTYGGSISFDRVVRESLNEEVPFALYEPRARSSRDLCAIVAKILSEATDEKSLSDIIQRELLRVHKVFRNRVVEYHTKDVDPAVYVVDRVKVSEKSKEKESASGLLTVTPGTWSKLAIDCGTTNTRIFVRGRGIILTEPTIMSLEESSGDVVALGYEAKAMVGRAHAGITIVAPMASGAISDYTEITKLIREFIKLAKRSVILIRPGVILTIPLGLTSVESKAVQEFVKELGAREVHLVYEPFAAAIGVGLPVDVPRASMLVNIGGGSTSAIVISISGIVSQASGRIGSNDVDHAIIRYLRDYHNFSIGEQTAEWIKIHFGQAEKVARDKKFPVRGQDLTRFIPKTLEVSTAEIREAINKPVKDMVKVVFDLLENVPPELSGDLIDRGMTLTGGGALLSGLDTLLAEKTGIKVTTAPNALTSAVEGAGRMLDDFKFYSKFFVESVELQKV